MLWQKGMIKLATNQRAKQIMQGSRKMTDLASRFVGGQSVDEAAERADLLLQNSRRSSLFYLGEYVHEPEEIKKTVSELEGIIQELGSKQLDIHISVDPTQIGLMNTEAEFEENALRLSKLIKEHSSSADSCDFLMIDMEDSSVTQTTLDVYHRLHSQGLPCGITLQAYLRRTKDDLAEIVAKGGKIRLVKGAFAENKDVAFTRRDDIDKSYFELAQNMLSSEAKETSFYPIFGTHDEQMIERIVAYADANGWQRDEYEFEFLLGVRGNLQEELVANGTRLRLYVPFGTEWWAYSVRRVGENPRNGAFLLRSLFYR